MIYFFLYLISAIFSLLSKHSKIIGTILVCLLFIMTVFSQNGNDINNIKDLYEDNIVTADLLERSSLFVTVILYCSNAGITFTQFRILQFIIWFTCIFFFIKRFSKFPVLVLACCLIFPMCSFGAQFRNGIMVGFLYLALYCLFSLEKKKGIIAYCVIIALASLVHSLALIYYSLLFVMIPIERKKFSIYCFLGFIAMAIAIKSSMLLGFVANNFGDWSSQYFSELGSMGLTMFILVFGLVANLFFTNRFGKIIQRNPSYYNDHQLALAEYATRINYVLLALVPLLFCSLSFYRIFQNLYILTAIISINSYCVQRKSRNKDLALFLFIYAMITIYYNKWQGEFLTYLTGIHL